jgi:phage protein D/phage baseplate assembly protein gpV
VNAPVQVPRVSIELDGATLPAPLDADLLSLRVQQKLSVPSLCELCFRWSEQASAQLRLGAQLRVGIRGKAEELFLGSISALDYIHGPSQGSEMRVRAYDALWALRQRQPVRAHQQQTLLALARELTADLGLTVDSDIDGPLWQRLIQTGSDLALLAELAHRCGLYFTLRGTRLMLLSLAGIGAPLPLKLGANLLEAHVEINASGLCSAVTANGWDPWHAQAHGASARVARSGRKLAMDDPAGADERRLVGVALQDDAQAEALAQATLDLGAARAVTFVGVSEGDPALRPGCLVALDGVARCVTGKYVLTEVTHTLDAERGFQSELSSMPPPVPPARSGAGSALGVVTRVDDPEQLGRIQVALPAFCNVETDWLEVLAAGAGQGKGLLALPDIGDTVLLLLAANDPTQAVVIGSLFAANRLPEGEERVGEGASFSFISPGGHKLRLDDGTQTVRIEDLSGSFLELAPGHLKLHAAGTLEIDAPGQRIFVRGQKVDFVRT